MDRHINEISELVIGSAMRVLNSLKPGLDEKLDERALVLELTKLDIQYDQQKSYEVLYDTQIIGTLIPDLIIENSIVVDTKVVSAFNDTHVAQMLGYLNITGLKIGLLLNFKSAKLGIKRVSAF